MKLFKISLLWKSLLEAMKSCTNVCESFTGSRNLFSVVFILMKQLSGPWWASRRITKSNNISQFSKVKIIVKNRVFLRFSYFPSTWITDFLPLDTVLIHWASVSRSGQPSLKVWSTYELLLKKYSKIWSGGVWGRPHAPPLIKFLNIFSTKVRWYFKLWCWVAQT